MNLLLTQVRATLLFYRSVAPFMLGVSGLLLGAAMVSAMQEGFTRNLVFRLLLLKLATAPVVWYLSEQLRPGQYWFYFNLHISRRQLWASMVGLDAALFLGGVGLVLAVMS
ncbi:hypothetical protein ACFP2F_21055 [Hymenobacter artigasi]|uniref:Uncharacterized protein n=1 Tax=Hymenobacter artigasi TaxID=2719616 RepID=A0ABX1HNB4_9BACT|nr:hypothetical protein [Hymenobacter artigasi]NKI91749.1 hypothetical protein [Hymenobacter artigasi]